MASAFALRNIVGMDPNGLKAARKRLGLGQPEIAERLNVSVPQVSRWENGRDNVPSHRLRALAAAYEAGLGELFGGEDTPPDLPDGAMAVASIPLLGDVPAGSWKEAFKSVSRWIPAPEAGIPKTAYALRVSGDSMDKYVKDGGTLIVDPTDTDLFNESFFIVRNADGETTFKQYLDGPSRLEPCSNNPAHKTILLGSEEVTILGRVILVMMRPGQAALA